MINKTGRTSSGSGAQTPAAGAPQQRGEGAVPPSEAPRSRSRSPAAASHDPGRRTPPPPLQGSATSMAQPRLRADANAFKGASVEVMQAHLRDRNYTDDEAVRVQAIGGMKALRALATYHDALASWGVSRQTLLDLASQQQGAESTLRAMEANMEPLTTAGYSVADVVYIASAGNAEKPLEALLQFDGQLTGAGFDRADLVRMMGFGRGAGLLTTLAGNLEQLLGDFTPTQIVRLTRCKGNGVLQLVVRNRESLLEHFSPGQIARMGGHELGLRSLQKLLATPGGIPGFSSEDLTCILERNGGAKVLDKAVRLRPEMTQPGCLSHRQFVKIAAYSETALDEVLAHLPVFKEWAARGGSMDEVVEAALHRHARVKIFKLARDLGTRLAAADTPTTGAPAPVKVEPIASDADRHAPVLVERMVDHARTAFLEELGQVCDITGERPEWSSLLADEPAVVVSHAMEPDDAMDHVFPYRDPDDPLGRVHARFARDDGSVHPKVAVSEDAIRLGAGGRYLEQMVAEGDWRVSMTKPELETAIAGLKRSVRAEMERLIASKAPEQPRCTVQRLREEELLEHEKVLAHGHGLKAPEVRDATLQPTLRNGRILGIYAGVLTENADQHNAYVDLHPGADEYDMEPRRRSQWRVSALGAANSMAYANTALKADKPEYDDARINAMYIPFEVPMIDKDGRKIRLPVVALVGLDNLYDAQSNPHRHVLAHYGEGHPLVGGELKEVKIEPMDE